MRRTLKLMNETSTVSNAKVEIASTVPVSEESLWVTPCCSLRFTSAQVLAARSAAATCLQRRQR
jgi:hypothetical protein